MKRPSADGSRVGHPYRRRMRLSRTAPALVALALVAAPAPPSQAAARGALAEVDGRGSCAAGRGISGCVTMRGLIKPNALAFAGAGRDLYVGAVGNGGLFQLRRDPRSGRLSPIAGTPHCWGWQLGCREHAGEQTMPRRIAIPGDERHVYVPSAGNPADAGEAVGVVGYARNVRSGALSPLPPGVICPREQQGRCVAPRGGYLNADIVATRDGRFVYGASARALVVLAREPATGGLRQLDGKAGCLLSRTFYETLAEDTQDCARETSLGELRDLALSPDGRDLYAAGNPEGGRSRGGLTVLRRDQQSGALAIVQTLGAGWVDGAQSVVPSPDGKTVYVVDGAFSIHVLRRGADGRLAQLRGTLGCLSLDDGCTVPPASSSPELIAIAPDGRSLYTADAEALDAWTRDRRGAVHRLRGRDGCHTASGLDGGFPEVPRCRRSTLQTLRMGLSGLAASPDGRHLYVTGSASSQGYGVGIVEILRRR
jgi:DNA-binding beta-propeller fold protein YncE